MQLTGIHHLTAVTAEAARNLDFYTRVLGLRLVKKTVNQDDVSAYHLFYADGLASPGTDITFFDWPVGPERRGTHSIVRTAFRVSGQATLQWWQTRLESEGVVHQGIVMRDKRLVLDFEDFEGQRLTLIDDGGEGEAHPWEKSPVPANHQIRGLGPITISVPDLAPTAIVLTKLMMMREAGTYPTPGNEGSTTHVFEMGDGGAAAELHVAVEPGLPIAQQGAGSVHHVAFRVPDADYEAWAQRLAEVRLPSSGPVDRYYFRSLYFREPNGILFEIATDGPGFATDEPLEQLGERLALPPFLEPRRAEIEAGLKPL
ncbi:ring-cleaving dioxygenase [Consotaella salsifontis]|uniref:Glyoxalase family protein n=1 Tax=Consotaella salsifontis TaxID=1365950 RepID=A0A1T4QIQ2_9HYPH|nr:ring-cleaving dioxygenase [Consotaella salsifontis]SKA03589.1 glyoxalase family protein [Consotaella salsifontis]